MLLLEDTTNTLFLSSFTQFFVPAWLQVSVLSGLDESRRAEPVHVRAEWERFWKKSRLESLPEWSQKSPARLFLTREKCQPAAGVQNNWYKKKKKKSQKITFPVDWGSNDICSKGEVTARVSSERPLIHKTLPKLLREGFYWGKGWAFRVWPLRCRTLTRLFA